MSRTVYNAPVPSNMSVTNADNNFLAEQTFVSGVKTADITAAANVIALHASSSVGIISPELAITGNGTTALISTSSDSLKGVSDLGGEMNITNSVESASTLTTASAQNWDLGGAGSGIGFALVTTAYITVTIGGTPYKLALVS